MMQPKICVVGKRRICRSEHAAIISRLEIAMILGMILHILVRSL